MATAWTDATGVIPVHTVEALRVPELPEVEVTDVGLDGAADKLAGGEVAAQLERHHAALCGALDAAFERQQQALDRVVLQHLIKAGAHGPPGAGGHGRSWSKRRASLPLGKRPRGHKGSQISHLSSRGEDAVTPFGVGHMLSLNTLPTPRASATRMSGFGLPQLMADPDLAVLAAPVTPTLPPAPPPPVLATREERPRAPEEGATGVSSVGMATTGSAEPSGSTVWEGKLGSPSSPTASQVFSSKPRRNQSTRSRHSVHNKVAWEGLSYELEEALGRKTRMSTVHDERTPHRRINITGPFCVRLRRLAAAAVFHPLFEAFFAVMIVTNALLIGAETVYFAAKRTDEAPLPMVCLQVAYSVLFFIELSLRLIVYGSSFFRSESMWFWNYLDLFIVTCSIFDHVVDFAVASRQDSAGVGTVGTVTSLSRAARLMRILRMAKLMFFLRGLQVMVYSIMATFRALVWAVLLMVLIIYLYAVLLTQAATQYLTYGEADEAVDVAALLFYWGSLQSSMMTLFKTITDGVSWELAMKPLLGIHLLWAVAFISFITFTHFAVLNVMTGVFCNSAIEQARRHKDLKVQEMLENKNTYVTQLSELFKEMDVDNSGSITVQEFARLITDNRLQAFFCSLDLDPGEASIFFQLLDENCSKDIDLEEFVTGCLRLRGGARAMDIASLRYESRWLMRTFIDFANRVEESFGIMHEVLMFDEDGASVASQDLDGIDAPRSEGAASGGDASEPPGAAG